MAESTSLPVIRLAIPDDAPGILDIYGPIVRETTISFETVVPSRDEMTERVRTTLEHFPWLVATDRASILGYAYAGLHRKRAAYQWSCEVSVYVHPDAHRRGVATGLYRCLFDILELQGFRSLYAGITQPNEKSVSLHRAMGFEPVGTYKNTGYKFGGWCDVEWWQQSFDPVEGDGELPAPKSLRDLLSDPELTARVESLLEGPGSRP